MFPGGAWEQDSSPRSMTHHVQLCDLGHIPSGPQGPTRVAGSTGPALPGPAVRAGAPASEPRRALTPLPEGLSRTGHPAGVSLILTCFILPAIQRDLTATLVFYLIQIIFLIFLK